MTKRVFARGEDVRRYVLENVTKHPKDISTRTRNHFKITRQAVNLHLHNLVKEGALTPVGNSARVREYRLAPLVEWRETFQITHDLAEDIAWNTDALPIIQQFPANVVDIWHYCFTEMFNNAIDHSDGKEISVQIIKTAADTHIAIIDDGVGIFKKIQNALGLLDERHAVLELSKGKLTTDPKKHSGQGIFFTSRLVDKFDLLSGGVYFSHIFGAKEDWILETNEDVAVPGTTVLMRLNNHSCRNFKKITDQFSDEEDAGFIKTVVPVKLAKYGNENLISRSQAKRLLARVEKFKVVMFDFTDVETIGQAFADEVFRVFAREHPDIQLAPIHANSEVRRMIIAAKQHNPPQRNPNQAELDLKPYVQEDDGA